MTDMPIALQIGMTGAFLCLIVMVAALIFSGPGALFFAAMKTGAVFMLIAVGSMLYCEFHS